MRRRHRLSCWPTAAAEAFQRCPKDTHKAPGCRPFASSEQAVCYHRSLSPKERYYRVTGAIKDKISVLQENKQIAGIGSHSESDI
jgi:hypothetical protein